MFGFMKINMADDSGSFQGSSMTSEAGNEGMLFQFALKYVCTKDKRCFNVLDVSYLNS